MGLSKLGYQFIAGLMHSAEGLAAITNPTVNSYKRINAPRTLSGSCAKVVLKSSTLMSWARSSL